MGRRVLRQHWLPLAAGYRGAAAALPRPHRPRGPALEEAARPRHTGRLPRLARAEGLRYVELTTDPDNPPSQRVIEANGGVLVERFVKQPQFGSKPGLRYRIALA